MFRNLIAAILIALPVTASGEDSPQALQRALAAVTAGDWVKADIAAADAGPLTQTIVDWHRLRAGQGSFAEHLRFVTDHGDWPGMPLLRQKGELQIGDAGPDRVLAFFGAEFPQTASGALALARAHEAQGAQGDAQAELVRAWHVLPMTASEHAAFIKGYRDLLAPHHEMRLDRMLGEGELEDARRMLPLVSDATRAVAEGRIALQTNANGIDAILAKAIAEDPEAPGLALDRFNWRMRKGLEADAIALLLARSGSVVSLGDPALWAEHRRWLARGEMRAGNDAVAYRIAAENHLTEGRAYADLEWLAGYIALRKLGRPEAALAHFTRFRAAVTSPISQARGSYWQARAFEALKRPAEADAAWREAARWQTSFYGLLAAEKLGLDLDPALLGREAYPDWRGSALAQSTVFQAAVLLKAAGERKLAIRFLLQLAEGLTGEEIGLLAGLALEWGDANMALHLAKAAAEKGRIWPAAYYPITGLAKLDLPVSAALTLAVARRESEFDPAAMSGAGARGLMQVMPETAKAMARQIGEPYVLAKLTDDADYNARLGAAYLEVLREEFGSSILLIAAGYNAGPGRPRRWITQFGDPRSAGTDPVDWVEHIPFDETQTYVMRVAEGVVIYRARLAGKTGRVNITDELKGR